MYVTDTKVSKHFSCKILYSDEGGLYQRFVPLEEMGRGGGMQTISLLWNQENSCEFKSLRVRDFKNTLTSGSHANKIKLEVRFVQMRFEHIAIT